MKKKLLTFLLLTSITTVALADTWHFKSYGPSLTLAHGVTYTPAHCTGYENMIDVTGNPTDPFTYYYCNGSTMEVTILACGHDMIFDLYNKVCTNDYFLGYLLYPAFPWNDYYRY